MPSTYASLITLLPAMLSFDSAEYLGANWTGIAAGVTESWVSAAIVVLLATVLWVLRKRIAAFISWLLTLQAHEDDDVGVASFGAIFTVWHKTVRLAVPEVPWMVLSISASLVSSGLSVFVPVMQGHALDKLTTASLGESTTDSMAEIMAEMLLRYAFFLGALEAIKCCCAYVRAMLSNNVGDRIRARAQKQMYANLLSCEVGFFDKTHTSELDRYYHYLDHLHYFCGHQLPSLMQHALTLVACACYMVYCNPTVGGVVVAVLLVQGVAERAMENLSHECWVALRPLEQDVDKHWQESFSNVRFIKHFSCEDHQIGQFEALIAKDAVVRQRLVHVDACEDFLITLCLGSVTLLSWYLGLLSVVRGQVSLGDVSAFAVLVSQVREAASGILYTLQEATDKTRYLVRAFESIERKTEMPRLGGQPVDRVALKGHVELRNVRFSYPSRPDTVVLNGLNLKLEPNKVTALCGPSGAGKSTIADLVMRSYDPSHGAVLVDGVDVRDLDLTTLHHCMAVVSQEPTLFATSIRDNIAAAAGARCSEVSHAEVERACRLANAHEFICGFEQGYDTEVGEKGVRLSGGQKQRVALARAILADPKILILDEATSALDSESEHLVQEALDRVMVGRTTLVVAHRLSTIEHADAIAVIDGGKVVEQGSHKELISKPTGAYRRLVDRQLGGGLRD